MNTYSKEEDLFNKSFWNSVLYIFKPNKFANSFVLTEYVSQNPLRVRALQASENLHDLIKSGKNLATQRSIIFIDNEIYSPY